MDYSTVDVKSLCSKFSQKWLYDRTLYVTVHGSHCYGTNTETSDLDLRGICIAPKEYYIGILDHFEQAITNEPEDLTIFEISKFVKLAMDCNPNALEIIFTEPRFHILNRPEFKKIFDIKECFLSKKARWTFAGYARSQLRRAATHRKWLLNPIKEEPTRESFGLTDNYKRIPKSKFQEIDAEIRKVISEWTFDSTGLENDVAININNNIHDIISNLRMNADDMEIYAARNIGLDDNLFEAFRKEREYRRAVQDYKSYKKWEQTRNPSRYELEKKVMYDSKNGAHLIRLYTQCIDLLKTGQLKVFRDDAEYLLDIRNGGMTYDQLIAEANRMDAELEELYKTSTLKNEPDRKKINETLMETIEEFNFRK